MIELVLKIISGIIEAYNKIEFKISFKKVILLISITTISLVFGFLVYQHITDKNIRIEIIHPADKDLVSIVDTIRGESKNIPNDKSIWIAVYDLSTRKYLPSHSPVQIVNNEGDWESIISIGASSDVDSSFNISAYLMDSGAVKELERNFSSNIYSGLDSMPLGSKSYHKITVRRK